MAGRDYALTRYSGLDQIDSSNVARLQVAWTFSTGIDKGHEAAPVVVGSTMYLVTRPEPFLVIGKRTTFPLDVSLCQGFSADRTANCSAVV